MIWLLRGVTSLTVRGVNAHLCAHSIGLVTGQMGGRAVIWLLMLPVLAFLVFPGWRR